MSAKRNMWKNRLIAVVLSGVWLAFLFFPISTALTFSPPQKFISLANMAGFVVVYLYTMSISPAAMQDDDQVNWRKITALYVVACGFTVVHIVMMWDNPFDSASILIFMMALAVYTLPPRIGPMVGAGALLGVIFLTVGANSGGSLAMSIIAVAVYIASLFSNHFGRRDRIERETDRKAAALDERERVARDVHDVLGHSLTVIAMKSELAGKLIDRDLERAKAEIAEITGLARIAISEVRSTVAGLRFREIADELTVTQAAAAEAGIELIVAGNPKNVDPAHRILFGWVLREAFTNVLRHSGANKVTVSLDHSAISVSDNGHGFDPTETFTGHGLAGLRGRVQDAGGRLVIDSGSFGTTVTAILTKELSSSESGDDKKAGDVKPELTDPVAVPSGEGEP